MLPGRICLRPWSVQKSLVAACLASAICVVSSCGPPRPSAASEAERAAEAAAAAKDVYVIGPGDVLGIFVYRSPELSTEVPVRPDGRISMPLVQDVTAAGKTPPALSRELEQRLKEYIRDPNVTVIVRGFVGPFDRQVRVIGEAAEPAAIPYREHMTVLDVMIATKGLTRYAAGNSAVIVRSSGPSRRTLNVRLSDLIKDGDISQNVEMLPGDVLIIPQTWF
ncbi:MAG: polysaccharide export protein [Acetobacteraceae bacterium]|nr:polysaccharide export protein [Acetobacteraceae bacterium]